MSQPSFGGSKNTKDGESGFFTYFIAAIMLYLFGMFIVISTSGTVIICIRMIELLWQWTH